MICPGLAVQLHNNLVHEFACFLHLSKLVLKVHIEIAQMEHLLAIGHALDSSEQIVRHIVRMLKNVVLLTVNLAHGGVRNLINSCILLFDEVLDTFQAIVHTCDGLFDGHVQVFKVEGAGSTDVG